MRSAIRPILVTIAVAGLSLAGVASAQAYGHDHGHGGYAHSHPVLADDDDVRVEATDRSHNSVDDSLNGNIEDSYNDSLLIGGAKES
ncbi:hypothetical protein [Streptomyces zagrosensis]|uniref:Chaplin domain-containing protein n=1 Tax=Streptomyces zagrosensis TaxID=1042984 RepID=A0A7W9QAM1_9ACTN|nr:hypothetical protein [Streptomyces zagrosensis]MBB5936474.1 hypothetical protein [Streptomyces zagrosensis]